FPPTWFVGAAARVLNRSRPVVGSISIGGRSRVTSMRDSYGFSSPANLLAGVPRRQQPRNAHHGCLLLNATCICAPLAFHGSHQYDSRDMTTITQQISARRLGGTIAAEVRGVDARLPLEPGLLEEL